MDRRSEHRVNWNESIQYRVSHAGDYSTGIVGDIAISGALLWLKEDLAVGSRIELLTGSLGDGLQAYMRVVRTEDANSEGYAGYGCRVEMKVPKRLGLSCPRTRDPATVSGLVSGFIRAVRQAVEGDTARTW